MSLKLLISVLFMPFIISSFIAVTKANSTQISNHDIYNKAYPNGDVYLLIGYLSEAESMDELRRFSKVASKLTRRGYKVTINPAAYPADLAEAVTSDRTSLIIWSGHGAEDGQMFAQDKIEIPKDFFDSLQIGKRLKFMVLSNCHGLCSRDRYGFKRNRIVTKVWDGKTNTAALIDYLLSYDFDQTLKEKSGNLPQTKCKELINNIAPVVNAIL